MGGILTQSRAIFLFNLTFNLKFKANRLILINYSQNSIWLKLSNKYFLVFHLSKTFSKSLKHSKNFDKSHKYLYCDKYLFTNIILMLMKCKVDCSADWKRVDLFLWIMNQNLVHQNQHFDVSNYSKVKVKTSKWRLHWSHWLLQGQKITQRIIS